VQGSRPKDRKAREVEQRPSIGEANIVARRKGGYRFPALDNFHSLCEHIPVAPVQSVGNSAQFTQILLTTA